MQFSTELLTENQRRLALYFRQYDPVVGDAQQQVVPRTQVCLSGTDYYLPTEMTDRYPFLLEGSLEPFRDLNADGSKACGRERAVSEYALSQRFSQIRLAFDFEYWCFLCVKIQDKLSKRLIPFRLNYGQRCAAQAYEAMRLQGLPIRVIIVKARQWGGSTVTQIYMLWLQLYHYKRWHSAIVSQLKNQAINIRSMLSSVIANYPTCVPRFTLTGFENLSCTKYIPERECKIQISSAETPDALRSFDFSMLHLSEVGLWKSTPAKSAEDLVQTLYSTVPYVAGTLIVMESTAKGVGNFFHTNYLAAVAGDSVMRPLFVPWFAIEHYARFRHTPGGQAVERGADGLPVSGLTDPRRLVENFTPYQEKQWMQGATLEGIAWYADTQRGLQYSDFMMRSEYPGSDTEAFQAKSNRYYEAEQVEACRSSCRPPLLVGNLRGDADKGSACLCNLRFTGQHCASDELRVWIRPDEGEGPGVSDRFLVVVDIGGLSAKADWSVISVFDRRSLANGCGALERAATWRGHIDHDLLAWKAVQIAHWYGNALLAIESNTLETKDAVCVHDNGADHFYTVIDEIADTYPNLYMRSVPPEVAGGAVSRRYGWHTNVRTKYLAYDQSRASIRDGEFVEHDLRCCDEMDWLEKKPNGSLGAIVGQHDDLIDTTAIALYISTREMPLPRRLARTKPSASHNPHGGLAAF
ncbi:MAG: hypothetical protein J5875_11230 [Paludibacteraceae bacterium]|nr:hypothetical protein [Paludibacteraceae bacterium]